MTLRTSPYHTKANYERLAAIILPMQTVEEFIEAFPECTSPANQRSADPERRQSTLEWMQKYPKASVDGIIDHVCPICGTIMLERFFITSFFWCLDCNDKIHDLFNPTEERNGITKVGQKAARRVMMTEFRIPQFEEVQRYELKNPPRSRRGIHG